MSDTMNEHKPKYCPVCCLVRSGAMGGFTGMATGGSIMALITGPRILNKSMTASKGLQAVIISTIGTGIGSALMFTGYAFGSHRWRAVDRNSFNIIGASSAAVGAIATSIYCGYLWSDLVRDQTPRHSSIIKGGLAASVGAFIIGGVSLKSLYHYMVLKRKIGVICIPDLLD